MQKCSTKIDPQGNKTTSQLTSQVLLMSCGGGERMIHKIYVEQEDGCVLGSIWVTGEGKSAENCATCATIDDGIIIANKYSAF